MERKHDQKDSLTEKERIERSELFESLFVENDTIAYGLITSKICNPDDVDDIFQDTVLAALKDIDTLKDHQNFGVWFCRIAKHRIADYWRRKITRKQYEIQTNDLPEFLDGQVIVSKNSSEKYSNEEKLRCIHETINTLPEDLRLVFILHFIEGMTYLEIAESLSIHKNTVKYRIKRAKSILSQKTKQLFLFTFSANIDHERAIMLIQKATETFRSMPTETITISTTVTAASVETANVVANTALSNSVETATHLSFHSIVSALTFPFLWVMSLLIGGRVCGTAFVVNAPTLEARRWLVKHLLFCYCGIVALPALFFVVHSPVIHFFTGIEYERAVISFFNWIIFVSIMMYMAWLQSTYKVVLMIKATDETPQQYFRLRHIVLSGLTVSTILLIGFCVWLLLFVIIPSLFYGLESQKTVQLLVSIVSIVLMIPPLLFHVGSFRLFHYFLSISKNLQSFHETSSHHPLYVRDVSTIELLLCVTLTIVPSILHLILIQTRIAYSVFELLVFGLAWGLVYYRNIKCQNKREMFVIGMFVIQITIMQIIRNLIFVS
jgi:RNA polymerase sigma-70 factor (ECF subfamily)